MSIKEINMFYNFRFYIVNFITSVMIIIIIVFWRRQSIKEIAIFMLVAYIIVFYIVHIIAIIIVISRRHVHGGDRKSLDFKLIFIFSHYIIYGH